MRMPQCQKVYFMSRQYSRRRKAHHRNAARIIIPSRVVFRDADERRLSWPRMEIQEAVDLLRDAVGESTGIWADLGAGGGTFTLALAELLGAGSAIYAVDADANAVHALGDLPAIGETRIIPVKADFTRPLELPGPSRTARRAPDGQRAALCSRRHGSSVPPRAEGARWRKSDRRRVRPAAGEPVGAASDSGGKLADAGGRRRTRRRCDHGHATVDVFGNSLCRLRDATVEVTRRIALRFSRYAISLGRGTRVHRLQR